MSGSVCLNDSGLVSSVNNMNLDESDHLITCPMNGSSTDESNDFEIMDHTPAEEPDAVIATLPASAETNLHYDVFIIHGEGDADLVHKFSTLITRFVKRNSDGQPISVCTEDHFLAYANNKFQLVELGLRCTPKQFVFLTSSKDDHWLRFKEEIAAVRIIERNTGSLSVIKTGTGIRVPFNLGACLDFLIPKLLKGKSLQDIDEDTIAQSDLDSRVLDNLSKLCNVTNEMTIRHISSEPLIPLDPITTDKGKTIQKHYNWFVEHIDPENGLLGVLFSKEIIRFRQMEAMKKEKTYFQTNEQLLNIVMRLNDAKMEVFEKALIETNQAHIVKFLENPSA